MPKSVHCVACKRRTGCNGRRTLKGERNECKRDSFSRIVGRNVIETDIICAKCNVQFGRGFFSSNINNTCSSQEQIGVHVNTFYSGTKSHKHCAICGKKQKRMKVIPAKARSQVFLKYNIILHNKARACLCHFASKELKDFDLTKYAHRT